MLLSCPCIISVAIYESDCSETLHGLLRAPPHPHHPEQPRCQGLNEREPRIRRFGAHVVLLGGGLKGNKKDHHFGVS